MKKLILFVFSMLLAVCNATAQVPPTTSTSGNDVWYYIQCRPRSADLTAKWLTGAPTAGNVTVSTLTATADEQLWKVVANGTGLALVNKKYNTYLNTDRLFDAIATSVLQCITLAPTTALQLVPYTDQTATTGVVNGFFLVDVNADITGTNIITTGTATFQFYSAGLTANYAPINYGPNASNINSAIVFVTQKQILLDAITIATTALGNSSEGINPGQFLATSVVGLNTAIQTAQIVYDNPTATTSEVVSQTITLNNSLAQFNLSMIQPQISNGAVEYWYYIQGTRPVDTYITAGTTGARIYELAKSTSDSQLWKFEQNGSGFEIKNKATGEYIQTDIASGTNLVTQAILPVNTLRFIKSSEVVNKISRFWIENSLNSTPAYRLHAGGTGNNYGLMNWTGNAADNSSWLITYAGPTISTSTTVISGLDYYKGAGPSAEQTLVIGGAALTSSITITPSANIQISKTSGSGFSNTPIVLAQSAGLVGATTLYVRLKAGLNFATYSDSISISSTNAFTRKVYCTGTVIRPTIVISDASITGLDYDKGSGPSAEQTFTVSGLVLSSNVVLTPSSNLQISKSTGVGFSNSAITLVQNAGDLAETTIYVRLKAGLNNASYSDSITITSTDAITKKIYCSGIVAGSSISNSTTSITGISYVVGSGPSSSKSFSLSANLLTANLIINPGSNYELSINNISFSPGSITLVPVSGSINLTTIYVRLKAGLIIGTYNQNITLQSTGVITKNISCSGAVLGPKLTLSTTQLSNLDYNYDNGPSDQQSFTISGSDLTSNVFITPPTNFQLSKVSGGVFTGSTISLAPTAGVLAPTTIYARLKAGLPVLNYMGNISITSTGVSSSTVACSGSVIDISTANVGLSANEIKVYSSSKGIVLEGVGEGFSVILYTVFGSQIYSTKADGKKMIIEVPTNAIYLLRVNNKTYKVIM